LAETSLNLIGLLLRAAQAVARAMAENPSKATNGTGKKNVESYLTKGYDSTFKLLF
jgi:hypothetical protein